LPMLFPQKIRRFHVDPWKRYGKSWAKPKALASHVFPRKTTLCIRTMRQQSGCCQPQQAKLSGRVQPSRPQLSQRQSGHGRRMRSSAGTTTRASIHAITTPNPQMIEATAFVWRGRDLGEIQRLKEKKMDVGATPLEQSALVNGVPSSFTLPKTLKQVRF